MELPPLPAVAEGPHQASPDSLTLRDLFFVKKAATTTEEEVAMLPETLLSHLEGLPPDSQFRVSASAAAVPGKLGNGSGSAEVTVVSMGPPSGENVLNRTSDGAEGETGNEEGPGRGGGKSEWSEGASEEERQEDTGAVAIKLESQRNLVHSQLEELQRIVTLQCRLTSSNPLAQELTSALLGSKAGKKTGSALPAESLRYLHAVFSVKDTITKKEARDIGLISGATLTQVREFFAAQRSQVQILVQQSIDKAERRLVENTDEQSQEFRGVDTLAEKEIGLTKLTGVESVELLLKLMRQEIYFMQQEKLLQVILQTESELVLRRFLEKGGLKILKGWLTSAATDEQTSVLGQLLLLIEAKKILRRLRDQFKDVLSHLPMRHAIPLQISALLQPINKLRFYFVPDVAARARLLMSKWSKVFMNKVKDGKPVVSSVAATITIDSSDSAQRAQKREREAALVGKGSEEQRKKARTELMKSKPGVGRPVAKTHLAGEVVNSHIGVSRAALKTVSALELLRPKSKLSPHAVVQNMPGEEALSKQMPGITAPRKEVPQFQQEAKARLSGKPVLDEIASNQTLNVLSQKPPMGPSPSISFPTLQVPKARGVNTSIEESSNAAKLVGGKKGAASNVRSFSSFPVSEAADAAVAVSRKRSPADQGKERRRVLPVDDTGSGNRWRDSTARRPVVEPGKTSRPLSADEIRKAKLRARIMRLSTSGITGSKSLQSQEHSVNRGKPSQVGDGWSLDRYTTTQAEDVGGKTSQGGDGGPLYRVASADLEASPALRQILDDETFDRLLLEQVAEAETARTEKSSDIKLSSTLARTVIVEKEPTTHAVDVTLRENEGSDDARLAQCSTHEEEKPLSPSIAVALSVDNIEAGLLNEEGSLAKEINSTPEEYVPPNTFVEVPLDGVCSESNYFAAKAAEDISGKCSEADFIFWVVPPVVKLDPNWGVAAGDASKEQEVQAARVKREEEEVYQDFLSIPANPKDLWDEEPVYDDTLTLEIPVEGPDNSSSKPSSPSSLQGGVIQQVNPGAKANGTQSHAQINTDQQLAHTSVPLVAEPPVEASNLGHDPNLLALLLNNPGLVSQLTSKQNKNNNLDGLSALLGLVNKGSIGGETLPTYAARTCDTAQSGSGVPIFQTTGSHLSGQLQLPLMEQLPKSSQPQVLPSAAANLEGCRPIVMPVQGSVPETSVEQVRVMYSKAAASAAVAGVTSWDPPRWTLPSPPPPPPATVSAAGLPPPPPQGHPLQHASNLTFPLPPAHGNVTIEHLSSGGQHANNGSWSGSFNNSCPPPLNTHVQTNAKQFDSRGRPTIVSHNVGPVNGASGMMPELVDVTKVAPYGQVMQHSYANHPATNSVHHDILQSVNAPFLASYEVNSSNIWPHTDTGNGFQGLQGRGYVLTPQHQQPLPGPPPPPHHLRNNHQHWQPHDPSVRPPLPPPHFRQDVRWQHQHPPAWHPNSANRGPNW